VAKPAKAVCARYRNDKGATPLDVNLWPHGVAERVAHPSRQTLPAYRCSLVAHIACFVVKGANTMFRTLLLGLVTIGGCLASPILPAQSATTSIGALSYLLGDLDRADGVSPSIVFTSYESSAQVFFDGAWSPSNPDVSSHVFADGSLEFAAIGSFAGLTTLAAFGSGSPQPELAGGALDTQGFVLSPNTRLTISALLLASVSASDPVERGSLFGFIGIADPTGNTSFWVDFLNYYGTSSSFSRTLSVAVESGSSPLVARVDRDGISVAVHIAPPTPIPEPSQYVLMVAGPFHAAPRHPQPE